MNITNYNDGPKGEGEVENGDTKMKNAKIWHTILQLRPLKKAGQRKCRRETDIQE